MRAVKVGAVVLALLCAGGGYAVADAYDVVPGVLTLSPVRAATLSPPEPVVPKRERPPDVLPSLSSQAPMPAPANLSMTLTPLLASPALGDQVSAFVQDAATGDVLFTASDTAGRVPASTTKLLTAAAALSTLGPQTRLSTQVVQGSAPDEIVLVGGGDTLLGTGFSDPNAVVGRAGLGTLAGQAAQRLRSAGISKVVVRVDDSQFTGPLLSPQWNPADVARGYVGPVTSLGLARDRPRTGHPAPTDPSLSAGRAFADALQALGIQVAGTPVRTTAPDHATVLAQVESAPIADILGVVLTDSDNTLAEVVGRLTARSMGRPATFEDTAIAVVDQIETLGVDTGDTHLVDVSGLATGDVIPARTLGQVLRLATSPDHPDLRPLIQGLPIAGFSGTLGNRFTAAVAHPAAGIARAKTGTLTGVSGLAGVGVDADGRLLVYVLMADRVPVASTLQARSTQDHLVATLLSCGCR